MSSTEPARAVQSRRRRMRRKNWVQKPRKGKVSMSLTHAPRNDTYVFERWCPNQYITETATDQFTGGQFSLNQVANYTEFTDMFQEYMLTRVVLHIFPTANVQSTTKNIGVAGGLQTVPVVYVVFDPNDSSAPASLQEMRQMKGLKVYYGYTPHTYTFYPKAKVPILINTAPTFGYSTSKSRTWIDTANPDVSHYALKMGFSGTNSVDLLHNTYDLQFKYTIACRRVR